LIADEDGISFFGKLNCQFSQFVFKHGWAMKLVFNSRLGFLGTFKIEGLYFVPSFNPIWPMNVAGERVLNSTERVLKEILHDLKVSRSHRVWTH
tara:strand:- start:29 stop:310 length:282 start_codon:yes stop_codon:yes gene_type:complete